MGIAAGLPHASWADADASAAVSRGLGPGRRRRPAVSARLRGPAAAKAGSRSGAPRAHPHRAGRGVPVRARAVTAASSARTRWSVLWFGTLAATTLLMLLARDRLDKAHVALVYLLVVLGGSALGGRLLGLTLAATAFLLFDVVFLPPYYRLQVADPLDWLVLIAFLVTGVVAAELLERQRHEAEVARARTVEIDRLATLGAETLNAPRPDEALRAIAEVIRLAMGTDRCDITLAESTSEEMSRSTEAFELPTRVLNIPLVARGSTVGTLVLSSDRPFLLGNDQKRVLSALSYYAALGVERVRLA